VLEPENADEKQKDKERRLEEGRKERLKYSYVKEDDGDIIDVELFKGPTYFVHGGRRVCRKNDPTYRTCVISQRVVYSEYGEYLTK
jgi:hypothetical protein